MTGQPGAEARSASAPELFPGGAPWLRARARNALRHPVRIGVVAGAVFLVTLLALIVLPAGQRRAAEQSPVAQRHLDTLPILARQHDVDRRRARATRALDSLRLALVAADSADSAAAERPRRGAPPTTDSVATMGRELSRLIARAERAPLPATYRDLAMARALVHDPRVAPLLDSLDDVVRAQKAYGTRAALDSEYVALTERARDLGATLVALARGRRSALRGDAPEDTLVQRARLDTLTREADATERQLALARQVNTRAQAALTAARESANVNAPPLAMLVAALALGLALGAAASLTLEFADPRFAGEVDAQVIVRAPIVGYLPEDAAPGLRDATERMLGRIAPAFPPGTRLAVIALDSAQAAHVAVAVATAVAAAGRAVLLVDTDTREARAATQLRQPATPGVTDVLARGLTWNDALQAHIGSHTPPLDVIPPGTSLKFAPGTVAMDASARALGVLADGYDLTLVTVTAADTPIAEALLAPARVLGALVVAMPGETSLAALRRSRERLATRGITMLGVVVLQPA
jgi:tyrosine-protein kinase Etk/Wzc